MKIDIGPYPNNSKTKRKVKIKIHPYDIWNMDDTLTMIILPMLRMMVKNKAGAPVTDDYDVPTKLRSTSVSPPKNGDLSDKNWVKRWDWIMAEILWTFEELNKNDNYIINNPELITEIWVETPDSTTRAENQKFYKLKKVREGKFKNFDDRRPYYESYNAKINNGLRLFGKYYGSLWT